MERFAKERRNHRRWSEREKKKVRNHVRARSSAVRTFLFPTIPLKARTTMPFPTQFICKCNRLSTKFRRSRPWSCSRIQLCHQRSVRLTDAVHERKVERSASLTVARPRSIYPPPLASSLSYLSFMQHQSVTASTSAASHHNSKDRRLCPSFIYLYVCLSLSSSHCLMFHLEQDAHLPLSLPDFSSIYHSVVSLSGIIQ